MKKFVLIAEAKIANWKSEVGYFLNINVETQCKLDQWADETQRRLENYLEESKTRYIIFL